MSAKTERKLSQAYKAPPDTSSAWARRWMRENRFLDGLRLQPRPIVFLDVSNRDGRISVTARTGRDFWLHRAGFEDPANSVTREVSSLDQLERMVGDAGSVVHQGDDLPREWQDRLQEKSAYLRNSRHSPKQELGEYVQASELLEHRAERGNVRILSALPQAREKKELVRQLKKMDLDTDEVEAWQQLQQDIDRVQTESEIEIEGGTKDAFLRELRDGTKDYLVLIAHFADGKLYFPSSETMTMEELSAIQRQTAPQRNVMLISCGAGAVNASLQSPSEILLKGKMAVNVIAHPDPVSALDVPAMLRDFLVKGKSIKEVFSLRGYQAVSDNLQGGVVRHNSDLS